MRKCVEGYIPDQSIIDITNKDRSLKTELETTAFLVEGQSQKAEVVQGSSQQQQQLNRRSRMETYCDILKAVAAGAEKPTHIMYRANLSWTVMQSYIKDLENRELVLSKDTDGKRMYSLTEKGFLLLRQYVSIKEDLNLISDQN